MRLLKLWSRFFTWALSVPVRVKIMGIALGVIFLLGLAVTLQVRATMTATMREELGQRGASIARDVAGRAADLILTDNLFALQELVKDTLENNEDVRYVFIVGRDRHLLAHTFGEQFPPDLLEVNSADPTERFRVELLETEEGLIHDVAAPILEGKAGIARVGMSERRLKAIVQGTTWFLLIVTALVSLVGVAGAYLLTSVLTNPVLKLVEVTTAVGRGDFSQKAPVWAMDEIGRLSAAFNAMMDALERSQEELRRKEEIRSYLLEKAIYAQEEERKRIARGLHDETSHALTSLMLGLKLLEGSSSLEEVQERTAQLRSLVAKALEEVHDLAWELRPSVLDDLGLVAALEGYIKDYARKYHLEVDFHASGFEKRRLPPQVETSLYRIVQEALMNVAKHADAKNVSVMLEHRGSALAAIVEDDGKGFDVDQVVGSARKHRKLGLLGMQERASLIGGELTIESRLGGGTTLFVEVPLEMKDGDGEDQTPFSRRSRGLSGRLEDAA